MFHKKEKNSMMKEKYSVMSAQCNINMMYKKEIIYVMYVYQICIKVFKSIFLKKLIDVKIHVITSQEMDL